MEAFKEYASIYRERDGELFNSIQQLNRGEFASKIYTCSHTLDALVTKLK